MCYISPDLSLQGCGLPDNGSAIAINVIDTSRGSHLVNSLLVKSAYIATYVACIVWFHGGNGLAKRV